jgi:hypothetical protein
MPTEFRRRQDDEEEEKRLTRIQIVALDVLTALTLLAIGVLVVKMIFY